jgi:hypothetical protein
MASGDNSFYQLRVNQDDSTLEYHQGGFWFPATLTNPGEVPSSRTISTTAPLTGGGDLSANRTFAMAAATTAVNGYLTAVDWTTFNNKQATGLCLLLTGGTVTGTTTFNKAVVMPTVDYSASTATPVTPDARNIEVYNVTVDANLTINGPTNPYSGQKLLFQLHNDASHVTTFATGSGNFRFGTDITSYTAATSKTDYVGAVWNDADTRWDIVSLIQGF